jgi:plasmid stabilization system protein ParE
MSRYLFRPLALSDLQHLLTYVASEDPQAALRMHESILETCTTIGENPEIAAELTGLSISGVRRFAVTRYSRYSIFYRIVDGQVEIIRLGYGGRDWEHLI